MDLIAPTVGGTPWGTGISEMAQAIAENRPQRVTGDQAAHIVEILEAISTSIGTERPVHASLAFRRPCRCPGPSDSLSRRLCLTVDTGLVSLQLRQIVSRGGR